MARFIDKATGEAARLLRALDPDARAEAMQWLRGFAAGHAGAPGHAGADRAPAVIIAFPGHAKTRQDVPGQEG